MNFSYPILDLVTGEKNMLQDEKTVLKSEVEQLQNELHERMQHDPMAESHDRSDYTSPNLHQFLNTIIRMQQQLVGPRCDVLIYNSTRGSLVIPTYSRHIQLLRSSVNGSD
ncbi:hypothetical protein B296_00035743 [Ensete ventricosum]|uniref:Uncharacterized protein n=1 Tax=Ensete ventricosum TaxID=4639 RepID=A0A426YDQ8_ENSVE|nr:hypothetical protein B296_00035743 [Ensete ventricosum]